MKKQVFVHAVAFVFLSACGQPTTSSPDADAEPVAVSPVPAVPALPATPTYPDWASPISGKHMGVVFAKIDQEACRGFVDNRDALYADDLGARYSGWRLSLTRKVPYEHFVATDDASIVRGASVATVSREDVTAVVPEVTDPLTGFLLVASVAQGPIKVYGLYDNGTSACLVAEFAS